MSPPHDLELGDRARILLRTLVRRYIDSGRPVGSRSLARDAGLSVSPATIRNVMADLEELGYLVAPHTSAGRVPTDRGLRFYVDCLLQVQPIGGDTVERLRQRLARDRDEGAEELADSASDLLSQLTRLAGVVTLPRCDWAVLRHVEFLPLSDCRVLAILVINERDVQNRVIRTERDFSEAELQRIANYLNAEFAGLELPRVRQSLLAAMQADQQRLDELMRSAVEVGEKALAEEQDDEGYVVAGQTNLMEFEELSDVDRLRQLFEAFTQKRDILHLLDRCARADGVQIYIGQEAGYEVFDGLSLVTARYGVAGEAAGVLGVIGPTRMAYDRIIPIVDVTARLVGSALNPPR
ncbi:heat-inducible transcriptional repressor HrcA [Halorhodospira halophila]|uniref:Heat-inducible transcription repressor HrcA n=1 Tax=Halorhodospira halophila (strain DSM 244 / SL1) TaxID=349124 RepID=A1WX33_HALHL|nr:heat-inducible transcriptional repressor HrcA [Halorhodospira halophila]ABM62245.1 heat-inducible transcription repressor HrcA [Halorhodospira halophila SL1]MBK1729220.1 heat-inducible transcription repressor HrcA [Halorhodospira halophila]